MEKATPRLNKFNSLQIFQFLRFGTFFLISVLLAKISNLYQHEYGLHLISQYENLMLVSSSLTFFWVSAICNTLIPYYNNADKLLRKKLLFNTFVLLTAFSAVAAIVVSLMGRLIEGKDKYLFDMFALVVLLNTPTYITDYIFYLNGKYKSLIRWGVVTFSAHVLLFCIPLFFKQSLGLAINMLLLLSLLKFNYTIILLMKHSIISVQTRLSLDFIKKALPIMFSILLAGSMEYINRYIIQFNYSEEEFALFSYASKELPIFLILANSLSNIYSGEIARMNADGMIEDGIKRLRESSRRLMHWLFPSTILLMFASPYMFKYLYSDQFIEASKIFNIYLLLIISRMIFPQTVIMGMMKNRVFYLISSNYLVINLLLSFWFINLFGVKGIAYATVVAYTIEKIMLAVYCKMEGVRFRQYTPVREYLLYAFATVSMYYLSTQLVLPMP